MSKVIHVAEACRAKLQLLVIAVFPKSVATMVSHTGPAYIAAAFAAGAKRGWYPVDVGFACEAAVFDYEPRWAVVALHLVVCHFAEGVANGWDLEHDMLRYARCIAR